ncbi:MAG: PDZ domain-containing protein [Actinomycetota bacterium]|nr:MAG: PDZ domain-containing protein [Actinomycetota bacterium]
MSDIRWPPSASTTVAPGPYPAAPPYLDATDTEPRPPDSPPPPGPGTSTGTAGRRRWSALAIAAAALLILGAAAGFGAGRAIFPSSATDPTASAFSPGRTSPLPGPGAGTVPGDVPPAERGSGGADSGGAGSGGTADGSAGSPSAAAAAVITPSIVNITTTINFGSGQAAGTGIVLTADGLVLTNNHVISGATTISAELASNGATYRATVVGYDKSHDIALIQLTKASGLSPATFAHDDVAIGDIVVGVGNAGGDGGAPSVAAGKVTGLNETITATDASDGSSETLHGLIETDAAIRSGDSGGPLVDTDGAVVGVNTAASAAATGQGPTNRRDAVQGYAIPSSVALGIAEQIRSGKATDTIHIGPTAFLGVQVAGAASGGVQIAGVVDGSAAAKAGLAAGDVLTTVDGTPVRDPNALSQVMNRLAPGDKVAVSWRDASGSHTATVTLTEGPAG